MTSNNLGTKIKSIRKTKGISQEKLAEITALTQQHISKIENGTAYPKTLTLCKIAKGLGLPIRAFIDDEVKLEPNTYVQDIVNMLNLLSDDDKNKVIGYIERLLNEKGLSFLERK